MHKGTLYLICPDCHIEEVIRAKFGRDSYFLTALGTVFNMSAFEYAEEVNKCISNQVITEIVIVNDIQCTFICNIVSKNNNCNTKAELELKKLRKNNSSKFESLDISMEKKTLAKLNIYRQAYQLLEVAFIGNKIRDEIITLSGAMYNREAASFENLELEFLYK